MGNICEIFSNKTTEKQQSHIATPAYLEEAAQNIPKDIPVQQYPIADGFTTGLLGVIILSDLADDCY
jgi:hypothetical protein